jgi:hypothetical protein
MPLAESKSGPRRLNTSARSICYQPTLACLIFLLISRQINIKLGRWASWIGWRRL